MVQRLGLTCGPRSSTAPPGSSRIRDGKPFSIGAFTVENGKIVEMDFLADPERIAQLDLRLGEPRVAISSHQSDEGENHGHEETGNEEVRQEDTGRVRDSRPRNEPR